jgi:hypothetical protein
VKLTASQQHNLNALYDAGGRLFREHFEFSATLGGKPIRGLNARTMERLVGMGLVRRESHNAPPLRWYQTYTVVAKEKPCLSG